MTGIRTTCKNNPPTGRVGCGASYIGVQLHCVAPADWSTHGDGICHETFGSESGCALHFTKDGHVDPRTVAKLGQDDKGIWRWAGDRDWVAVRAVAAGHRGAAGGAQLSLDQLASPNDPVSPPSDVED